MYNSEIQPVSSAPLTSVVHTKGHIKCPACELFIQTTIDPEEFGRLCFKDAAPRWLDEHRENISQRTYNDYLYYIRTLGRFFDALPLADIHLGNINAYAYERSATANAESINHEINTLKQVLDMAGLWSEIAKFYRPLKITRSQVGQAMEPEDEQRLFAIASSKPRWSVAYWCSIITATTTAAPCEIAHLHVNDIHLGELPGSPCGSMRIRDGLKNGYRERSVPLNEASRWAAGQMLKRYHRMCERLGITPDEDHYLLPGRGRSSAYDPWKPIGSWKKAWHALRAKAELPNLRMYDLRHHAITKLMEDPDISERTVEELAGHALSSAMKKRYSHIRLKPKADAAAKLELQIPKKPVVSVRNVDEALSAEEKKASV